MCAIYKAVVQKEKERKKETGQSPKETRVKFYYSKDNLKTVFMYINLFHICIKH